MRHRLPNGFTVLVEENRTAPVAALQVWVRVGSADERDDELGLAHLHEHMLFKGTAKRGPGEIARQVEACGGEINAWTSFDHTVYHLVLASRFAAEGVDILADAITGAAFDPGELSREIEVVCEEIKRSEDSPPRQLSKELFRGAFVRHPYGRPVIGSEASVRAFTRDGILRFYRRWYRPQNCTLVAVGDVQTDQILELAETAFAWPSGAFEPAPRRPPEPPRSARTVRALPAALREGYLSFAWPAPDVRHQDVPALDALSVILGNGETSRLHRALKREKLIASDTSATAYTPLDPGLIIATTVCPPQTMREAAEQTLATALRMRREEVSADELRVARRLLESDAVYQRETVQGQARKLGFYETSVGGIEFEQEYFRRLAAVTPAKLREVAEEWLDPRNLTAAALIPEGASLSEAALAELIEKAAADSPRQAAKRGPSAQPSTPAEPPLRVSGEAKTGPLSRIQLPNGAVLLVKEERAVPLVAVRVAWEGGLRAETAESAGVSTLLSRLANKGTQKRGAEALMRAFESMGGGMAGASGRNSFGLRAEFLSRHLREGLDLFLEAVDEPAYLPAEVDRERSLQLDELKARDDNPSGVAFQLFNETLFTQHPYRFDPLGSAQAVASLTPDRLERERARLYPKHAAVLAVVGDVDPREVEKLVAARFAGAGSDRVRPAPAPEPQVASPRVAVRTLEKAQAHLLVGYRGVRLSDEERWPLEVLSAVLSGQGGRLFIELRDKKSLAYSVTSFSVEGIDPGSFAIYIGCGPGKVQEALEGIRAELDRCRSQAPTAQELDRAHTHLIGAHAIGLQRNSARAALYAFDEAYGLGANFSAQLEEKIAAVTAEQVLAVAQKVCRPSGEVLALVAPAAAVPPALRG